MNLYCTGINHRSASIDIRERLWFSRDEIREFITAFGSQRANECVLVSTCNRTELYYVPRGPSLNGQDTWQTMVDAKRAGDHATQQHFYNLESIFAAKHLFSVACGIDSMVLGDVQILSQIKEGFSIAQDAGTNGILLNRLFETALHAGKRARFETEIGEGAVSISYAAAELASKIFEDLSRRSALLIGAGETGKLTAKHLASRRLGQLLLANRTRERAESLATQLGGTVVDFGSLDANLVHADIVISSVEAPSHVLTEQMVRQAMHTRGSRPLFIIDIGVPRNVEPTVNDIENVFLHDIDALNHIVDQSLATRRAEVPKVEQIILDELTHLEQWHKSLDVSPTIQDLRQQIELIRQAEVSKHLHHFAPENREELDLLTKRIINKILHTPIVNLKNGSADPGEEETKAKVRLVRYLFGLDRRREHE
jgi:glutamyl-tRNA reductase